MLRPSLCTRSSTSASIVTRVYPGTFPRKPWLFAAGNRNTCRVPVPSGSGNGSDFRMVSVYGGCPPGCNYITYRTGTWCQLCVRSNICVRYAIGTAKYPTPGGSKFYSTERMSIKYSTLNNQPKLTYQTFDTGFAYYTREERLCGLARGFYIVALLAVALWFETRLVHLL